MAAAAIGLAGLRLVLMPFLAYLGLADPWPCERKPRPPREAKAP